MQELDKGLHAAAAVSMARVVLGLLLLGTLRLVNTQSDYGDYGGNSGSGDYYTGDPTMVDHEGGGDQEEYILPFDPTEVNICEGYPRGKNN